MAEDDDDDDDDDGQHGHAAVGDLGNDLDDVKELSDPVEPADEKIVFTVVPADQENNFSSLSKALNGTN